MKPAVTPLGISAKIEQAGPGWEGALAATNRLLLSSSAQLQPVYLRKAPGLRCMLVMLGLVRGRHQHPLRASSAGFFFVT
jgi:hypothetical protein